MTAASQDVSRVSSEVDRHNPVAFQLQKGATTIWKGALVCKVTGKAQPALANTAGQTILGVPDLTYKANSTDTSWTQPPMFFHQGVFEFPNDSGDPVVVADIGSLVGFTDDSTVHHTVAGNDVTGICKWITPAGMVGVEIKNP